MRCNSKNLLIITLAYIYIPLVLFLVGFTAAWVWLITIPVCGYFGYGMYKDYAQNLGDDIKISWPVFGVVTVIISLICIVLGYGGLFEQAGDWFKHNAVLHDLVQKRWPVYYTEYEESMLTYYLGQYMVPAVFGKFARALVQSPIKTGISNRTAEVVMAVWGIAGIVLVYLNLIRLTKADTLKKQIQTAWILLFFSGALPLAQIVCNDIFGENMYSLGSRHWMLANGLMIQYRSNMVMLRWVFPQVVVIWLIVILFLENKKNIDYYVLLLLPAVFFGTFSVVIFSSVAIGYAIFCVVSNADKKAVILQVFSLSNIGTMVTLGTVIVSYFWGYFQVDKPEYMGFMTIETDMSKAVTILIFDFFMFGIYSICVWNRQRKSIIFYIVNVMLLVIPFFKMGVFNDWVMGTSIPGLFVIMIFVVDKLNNGSKEESEKGVKRYYFCSSILVVVLLVGSWYPFMELVENLSHFSPRGNLGDSYESLESYSNRQSEESEDMLYNYYTYDLDGKFFYEYLAANKIGESKSSAFSNPKASVQRVEGIYFDTYISITSYDGTKKEVLEHALEMCDEYSKIFSKTDEESELYRINSRANNISCEEGLYQTIISDDMKAVVECGLGYGNLTNGRFDIAMGAVSELWDFHSGEGIVPEEGAINEALKHVDYNCISIINSEENILQITDKNLKLDLGGIAKGYIANELRDYFIQNGSTQILIALGGNIMCIGDKYGDGYTVGIQKPYAGVGEAVSSVCVKDTSVVSSGVYERYIEQDGVKYHHILNPVTGYSANTDVAGVTIVCRDSMKADVLSTTVLMLGKEYGIEFLETVNEKTSGEPVTEVIFVDDNGNLTHWNYINEEE